MLIVLPKKFQAIFNVCRFLGSPVLLYLGTFFSA